MKRRSDVAVFPQFVVPGHGSVFGQSVVLGSIQIAVRFSINLLIVLFAAAISSWFSRDPRWLAAQRYVMGLVLAGLAFRLVLEERRS